jgi:hypothetical protein
VDLTLVREDGAKTHTAIAENERFKLHFYPFPLKCLVYKTLLGNVTRTEHRGQALNTQICIPEVTGSNPDLNWVDFFFLMCANRRLSQIGE